MKKKSFSPHPFFKKTLSELLRNRGNESKMKEEKAEKTERIVVAFATDSNYLYYTGVTLYTLLEHISSENFYHIVILSSHLSSEEQQFFQDLIQPYNAACNHVSWEYIDMEKSINEIGKENFYLGNYAIANYYRLFLCSLLENEKKVIYLDSDILVRCDIAELWQQDMNEYSLAAALDKNASAKPADDEEKSLFKYCRNVLKLKNSQYYFNTGVLLMDLEKLRKMDLISAIKKEVLTGIKFSLVDQDILNRLFTQKICFLDKTWNHQLKYKNEDTATDHLIHISGIAPWESERKPFASLWWAEVRKTPFYEQFSVKNLPARVKYLEKIENQYYCVINSTCWKLTYPLRASIIFTVELIRSIRKGK